ncbi:hypothetical protein [Arenibacter certesii]|uniref:YbbR-like domain-containing protein n=1 Tax=Arenibacter certesii TaxID=228955 RepID=A0A918J2A9_9FLAO|nr:hypothetical protein [Arenibacter certesii]GGW43180.1 hypothetical protein GCM10007383_29710 [Arenibacter certesii]
MINIIKNVLQKRKVKLFLIFLLGSSLAWFISNLAEQYTNEATFDLHYHSSPDSLLLKKVSKKNIRVRLKASGYQLLVFGFKNKVVNVDLSALRERGRKYYMSPMDYRGQIENELSKYIEILDMDRDTMFFSFQRLVKKKVGVASMVNIDLDQHYLLDKDVKLTPDSITVIGPEIELADLEFIPTKNMTLTKLTGDFSKTVDLELPTDLENTTYSTNQIRVEGEVFKFSERILTVPINVINVPEGVVVRTFPETAEVLCRDRLVNLKKLKENDFEVSADYALFDENDDNILNLEITKKMESINVVRLKEDKVEFILMKQ